MVEADLKVWEAAFDGENSTHVSALRWSSRICVDLANGGSVGGFVVDVGANGWTGCHVYLFVSWVTL